MIEFALEKFPVRYTLDNGVQCLVRPLHRDDQPAFEKFHLSVPENERFLIKHRYTDSSLFLQVDEEPTLDERFSLLAFADGQIVGHATLHQRPGGWKRHIGMVGVLTHPDCRGVGLSKRLIGELVEVARHAGLTRLEAEFNGARKVAIQGFKVAGFDEIARLPDYLQDMQAKTYDWVLLGMKIITDLENAGAGD